MARDQRLNIRGGTYHVMNRGNRKAVIFEDDRDRRRFLRILAETSSTYQVEVLVGALMGNHFHLVVLTPQGNLSEFMQQLEGQFAQYSNWRHGRVGHLFQGRFKGVLIENDIHLFIAFWYVVRNPVVAGYVNRPEDWKWSSYAATVGLSPAPAYLSLGWMETLFPSETFKDSQRRCRVCMNDPQPIQAYLQAAEPTAAIAIRSYITERLTQVAQPAAFELLVRPPIEQLFPKSLDRKELPDVIVRAHDQHLYKLAEIARTLGVHSVTISRIYRNVRKQTRLNSGSDPNCDEGG